MARSGGTFDSEAAKAAARARWENHDKPADEPEAIAPGGNEAAETPTETLRRLSLDPNVPAYAQVQAAKALSQIEPPASDERWKESVQVDPSYAQPTWQELLDYAKSIGAYGGDS